VGSLWSHTGHSLFFIILAGLAMLAAFLLRLLEKPIREL
jgi:hypothetical protein